MKFEDPIAFYHVVKKSWSQDTISDSFDPDRPCRNQCAVTALATQRFFGGEIYKTATKGGTHFYNRIADRFWDLATDQFDEPIPYDNTLTTADEAFEHASPAHLEALVVRISSLQHTESVNDNC
jgi:hypothetical protein